MIWESIFSTQLLTKELEENPEIYASENEDEEQLGNMTSDGLKSFYIQVPAHICF